MPSSPTSASDRIRFDAPHAGLQRLGARFGGHAYVADGFAYRMLYVDPAAISAARGGMSTPFVPDAVAEDRALADLLGEAFADFPCALEPLAVDGVVARLADLLVARSDLRATPRRRLTAERAVASARDFLVAEAHRAVASEEL